MRKFVIARGECEVEGCSKKKSKATGADEEDARHLFMHQHGSDTRHAFVGHVFFATVSDEEEK